MIGALQSARARAEAFKRDAHSILAGHEGAVTSRTITIHDTRSKLTSLSLRQEALFEEAFGCIETGAFRAAHVMAWAAFMDYLGEKLASDGLVKLTAAYPKWKKSSSMDDICEERPDFQLIEAAHKLKLLSKSAAKSVHGLLSKRNECAHPSRHTPDLNQSLGYVSDILGRIDGLQSKSL